MQSRKKRRISVMLVCFLVIAFEAMAATIGLGPAVLATVLFSAINVSVMFFIIGSIFVLEGADEIRSEWINPQNWILFFIGLIGAAIGAGGVFLFSDLLWS